MIKAKKNSNTWLDGSSWKQFECCMIQQPWQILMMINNWWDSEILQLNCNANMCQLLAMLGWMALWVLQQQPAGSQAGRREQCRRSGVTNLWQGLALTLKLKKRGLTKFYKISKFFNKNLLWLKFNFTFNLILLLLLKSNLFLLVFWLQKVKWNAL